MRKSIFRRSLRARGLSLSQESCSACAASLALYGVSIKTSMRWLVEYEKPYQWIASILHLHHFIFLGLVHGARIDYV